MRNILLGTSFFLLSVGLAYANDPYAQPYNHSVEVAGNQWQAVPAPQPVPVYQATPPAARPVAPAQTAADGTPLDINNAWNVMQYNFGM